MLVVTTPLVSFTDNLTAYDGVTDFRGTSGVSHAGILTTDTDSASSPPPLSDLTLFSGPPGSPGTIDLPVQARGVSSATGAGNLITFFQTSSSAEVTVCYTYELDCNQNGVPDADDIDQGTSNDGNLDGIPDECQPTTTSVCEGDGTANGGAACPCGNSGQPGEGCDNGSGSGGLLTASGTDPSTPERAGLTQNAERG